jgi:autonomous glycyl radical cofactor GrcA
MTASTLFSLEITLFKRLFVLNTLVNSNTLNHALIPAVTEPTNYPKLSKKITRRSRRFNKLKPV